MSVFDRVVGQEDVVATLRRAAVGDKMSHAWLLTGPPGSGRSVAALAFAAALLCGDAGCGTCASCRQVASGAHPDLVVVRPDGLSISVAEARRVVRDAALAASGGHRHVVLVEDADRLTEAGANAWLSALEEPASSCVFLLCAPSPDDLLPTIRSRCRHVALRLPAPDDVAALLVREGVLPARAEWAARAASAHVGRARALATDEVARSTRDDVLALPLALRTVGDALAAAAALVGAADEEAGERTKSVAAAETAAFEQALGTGRGTAGVYSEIQRRARSRESRVRRDVLDRALGDLVGFFRDVLSVQLRTEAALIHSDRSSDVLQMAAAATPEQSLRRIEVVVACRTALAANVTPLLALEQMTLGLLPG